MSDTATAKGTKRSITQETHTGQKKPRRRQPTWHPSRRATTAGTRRHADVRAQRRHVRHTRVQRNVRKSATAHAQSHERKNVPAPAPGHVRRHVLVRAPTSVNMGAIDDAPGVVQQCVADARRRAGDKARVHGRRWYADGETGLNAHQDAVGYGMEDMPIFSYSFVAFSNGHTNTHEPPAAISSWRTTRHAQRRRASRNTPWRSRRHGRPTISARFVARRPPNGTQGQGPRAAHQRYRARVGRARPCHRPTLI